jgi:hypothetical protein
MKRALSTLLGIPLLLPFLGGHHQLSRAGVEQALAHQMNAGRAVAITKHVDCRPTSRSRYACVLTGATGTRAHAVVIVSGGNWRAVWAPPTG